MAQLRRPEPQICRAQLSFLSSSPASSAALSISQHSCPSHFLSLDSAQSMSPGKGTLFPVRPLVHCPRMIFPSPVFSCPGHLAQGLKSNPWSELMGNVVQLVTIDA